MDPPGVIIAAGPRHGDGVSAWLTALRQDAQRGLRSTATERAYAGTAKLWRHWLDQHGIEQPGPNDIQDFLTHLHGRLSPALVNRHLHALRSCYRWLESQALYPAIARSARSYRVARDQPLPAFTRDEVMQLLAAVRQEPARHRALAAREQARSKDIRCRDEALIRVLFNTGLRLVSMHRLDVANIDLAGRPPVVRYRGKGHTAADATVFLAEGTATSLQQYLAMRKVVAGQVDGPLWVSCGTRPGLRMSTGSMRRIVMDAAERAGLLRRDAAGQVAERGRWSPHALRRTAATELTEQYGLEAGQALLDHGSIDTTRRNYVRVKKWKMLEQVRSALDLHLPPAE